MDDYDVRQNWDFHSEDSFAFHGNLYMDAMRIYCDIMSGDAFESDYEWSTSAK